MRLDNVFDAVNAVNETLQAVYSKKKSAPRPTRAPRPQTAYQQVIADRKALVRESIVDKLTQGR